MATTGTPDKLVDPRDLLEMLRQHPLTAPFNLAYYSEGQGPKPLSEAIRTVCAPLDSEALCTPDCHSAWTDGANRALLAKQPVATTCAEGFLCLIIPLPEEKGLPDCLIAGGVMQQDTSGDSSDAASQPPADEDFLVDPDPYPQMMTRQEAQSVAEEIFQSLPRLLDRQIHAMSLNRTTQRLEAVQKLVRELADCHDAEQAVAVVSEALVVLFNLPKVMIVLQKPGAPMTIHSTLGLASGTFQVDQKALAGHLDRDAGRPGILTGSDMEQLCPGMDASTATLFPLQGNDVQLGAILVIDIDLHSRDQALIELLVNRLATRLENLNIEASHHLERRLSSRLIAMISALSLVNSREELYRQILEMSAELLTATSGSFMLLNEKDGTLQIRAAKGMTSSLAKTMSVPFGEGIAGRVAKSGFPMLVNDIERDKRVASRNRPRFKTKSFVSLPLELDGRLIGVLNLADKSDGSNFNEDDLNLVQTFTGHAVLMIDRAAILEKAGKFEQLAITDPLTGLYNRRFLEDRLQQEFSRSERQKQTFCLILADLDSFKIYNDICGHLAGDNVLRRVAELMQRSAREMDIVTRYGGEEFCLILPGTGKKESIFVGERIRRVIEAESFPGESHLPLGRLTTSLGIASFPADGITPNELIHAADLALYRAKAEGRNRLVLYEPSLEEQSFAVQGNKSRWPQDP